MSEEVRPSISAGSWYPNDPEKLKQMIHEFFGNVESSSIRGRIFGLISPHAGFIYSGQTAAYAYKQLYLREFDVVVILCPMHHPGPGKYVTSGDIAYETPLGDVPVDRDLLRQLQKSVDIEEMFFDKEHAIENQLPFLQSVLSHFKILPIMVGHMDVHDVEDIVAGLTDLLNGRSALLVASTDLNHMYDYDAVKSNDERVINTLVSYDLTSIRQLFSQKEMTVCGQVPVSIVLDVAKRQGALSVHILNHTTSVDVIGSYIPGQYTVGYLSALIY